MVKEILRLFVPQFLLNKRKRKIDIKQLQDWQKSGCPVPPPHIVKQITIGEYQAKYGYKVLFETGTYLGDMVEAQKKRFKKIISIELGVDLSYKARKRFRKDKHIIIVQGDSGKVLPNLLNDINEPAIFWLDGHYSGGITSRGDKECPIYEELRAIFNSNKFNHILLIDDARCFNGKRDYPMIEELIEFVRGNNEKYQFEIKNDIIRFII